MNGSNLHDNGMSIILDSITDGLFILDKSWHFTYFNKAVEDAYHINQEDSLRKNFWEKFPKTKGLKYWESFNKAANEQVTVHFEEYTPAMQALLSITAYPMHGGLLVYFR